MSDQVSKDEATTECSVCGFVPGPHPGCTICHGNLSFIQKRHYTRSEEQQGKGNNEPDRYGLDGNTNPRIVDLPGSFNPARSGQ